MKTTLTVARRRLMVVLAVFLVLVWMLIGLSRRPASDEVKAPGAVLLTQAQQLAVGETYPLALPAAAPWTPVALPDNWEGSRPGYQGYVW